MLEWGYKLKPDSPTRRTKILDAEDIKVPRWTTELWALEPGRPELVEEAIKFYSPGGGCGRLSARGVAVSQPVNRNLDAEIRRMGCP